MLQLAREIKNTNPTADLGALGGVVFVGDDVLVGTSRTLDVPCTRQGADVFDCTVFGEVALFDVDSGALLTRVVNPSPDVVDTRGCSEPPFPDLGLETLCYDGVFFVHDAFGAAIAPYGTGRFLVGAPMDDLDGSACTIPFCAPGRVYLYDKSGALVRTFQAPAPGRLDAFGTAVAAAGNRVVIGAPRAGPGRDGTVFVFDGDTGALLRTIEMPDPQGTLPYFGEAVAAFDDVIVVAAPRWDGDPDRGFIDTGILYLFDAETGDLIKRIPGTGNLTLFGLSLVVLDGHRFSASLPNQDLPIPGTNDFAQFAGAVYVYDKAGLLLEFALHPEPFDHARFGCGISTSCVGRVGERLLIGTGGYGAAYLTDVGGPLKFVNPSPDPADACLFGAALATRGGRAAILDPCDRNGSPGASPRGSLFVYNAELDLKGSVKVRIDSDDVPLEHVKVELLEDLTVVETTYTDEMGEYVMDIPDGATTGRLRVTLVDEDGQAAFGDLDATGGTIAGGTLKPASWETGIDLLDETRGDIIFNADGFGGSELNAAIEILEDFEILLTDVTDQPSFADLATFYVHTMSFYEWARAKLSLDFPTFLELGLLDCPKDYSSNFNRLTRRITLCRHQTGNIHRAHIVSGLDPRDEKLYVLAHEFGHYIEYESVIGGVQHMIDKPIGSKGHDGYKNPNSSNALTEGLAIFLGMVMRFELYGTPPVLGTLAAWPVTNLEQTAFVPGVVLNDIDLTCGLEYANYAEEFAIASLLWDVYDLANEPSKGDDITLPIEEVWGLLTDPILNPLNPEIISTFEDVRKVLTAGGLDVFTLFADRLAYHDTNRNCQLDAGEVVGVTQWLVHDSNPEEPDEELIFHLFLRPNGQYNVRQNMLLEVLDAGGAHLTDFDLQVSVVYTRDPVHNFDRAAHVASSPYEFNAMLLQPGSFLVIRVLKEGFPPAFVTLTSDEFWTAYTTAPDDVGDALITKRLEDDLVDVPNVVGLLRADAEAALVGAGLTVGIVTEGFASGTPEGHVYFQFHPAGSANELARGSAVFLAVSLGPRRVSVPDLVGLPQEVAESVIDEFEDELTLGSVTTAHSEAVPLGSVISQDPEAGAEVPEGSDIDLVVSLGPADVSVPDVVGSPQAEAEDRIVAAGLAVGVVTTVSSDTVPAGSVISQTPEAGAPVAPDSTVDLVVSEGSANLPLRGDVDGDGDVDRNDVAAIFTARGEAAQGPDDPRDLNGDGLITVNDGRLAVLECTLPACAVP